MKRIQPEITMQWSLRYCAPSKANVIEVEVPRRAKPALLRALDFPPIDSNYGLILAFPQNAPDWLIAKISRYWRFIPWLGIARKDQYQGRGVIIETHALNSHFRIGEEFHLPTQIISAESFERFPE